MDCSKPEICETVDIHSEVPRHVETVYAVFFRYELVYTNSPWTEGTIC